MEKFLPQRLEKFILRHFSDHLSLSDQKALSDPPGNAEIGFPRLARAIDHTTHNGNFYIQVKLLHHFFYPCRKTDEVDLRPPARRTGHDTDAAFFQSQRF